MPGLSDTDEALDALISAIAQLPLSQVIADKLNPRPGVWNEIAPFLRQVSSGTCSPATGVCFLMPMNTMHTPRICGQD